VGAAARTSETSPLTVLARTSTIGPSSSPPPSAASSVGASARLSSEFVEPLIGWTIQGGVAHVPELRTQLVAAHAVAETLADAAEEPDIENGRITEVAGPREERLADAAAALFASRGDSFEIREGRQPGDPDAAAYAEGAALPNPGAKLAGPTFGDWLAAPSRR